MINRVQQIKQKGFSMKLADSGEPFVPVDFSNINVGIRKIADATLDLGSLKKTNSIYQNKEQILNAIDRLDYKEMRNISDFFYRTSGIYSRLCKYAAYMYRYDWYVTPYINGEIKDDKVLNDFTKMLNYLDNSYIKKLFGEIALKIVRRGCYYGYIIDNDDKFAIQELPIDYCRSRFLTADGRPAIEFNMKYFDDAFTTEEQREKILELFPEDFKKGYQLYRKKKLKPDFPGDSDSWYLLTIENAFKFNLNGEDFPLFMSVIPSIIDLDEAQDLDRKKMAQQLLKIIIQKMPIDKNGDLVFDVEEAQQLHNNAVKMLARAIGIDVLTTFADVEVADMSSSNSANAADESMDRAKSAVFDQAGVSQMQFNTDGNIALEKSILNDEASLYHMVQQFEQFLNYVIIKFNKSPKRVLYRAQILSTTIYNYKELSKMYKEQTALGYSKMLPQIALGQSQSSILANAYFENDILDLVNVFIPPMQSSTMNADVLNRKTNNSGEEKTAGRPEKSDDEKAEKTIANRESQN